VWTHAAPLRRSVPPRLRSVGRGGASTGRVQRTTTAARLQLRLGPAVGEGWDVLAAAGVSFDRHNYREPDVAVVRSAALAKDRLAPGDVLLVVEVMSPSSVATERVAKPEQYAAAGISHYWRLEQEPPRLVRNALVDGVYREAGSAGGSVTVRQPLAVEVDVDALFA
jgi:Uma2 family endonuclease